MEVDQHTLRQNAVALCNSVAKYCKLVRARSCHTTRLSTSGLIVPVESSLERFKQSSFKQYVAWMQLLHLTSVETFSQKLNVTNNPGTHGKHYITHFSITTAQITQKFYQIFCLRKHQHRNWTIKAMERN